MINNSYKIDKNIPIPILYGGKVMWKDYFPEKLEMGDCLFIKNANYVNAWGFIKRKNIADKKFKFVEENEGVTITRIK